MVLESTYICVDTSEYMRNGDYLPSRIAAQQDAVNMVAQAKLRSNPESNVGLMTLAGNVRVLVTLTTDSGKILSNTAGVKPDGPFKFLQGLKIAHLALKHRQGKNHKTRIVAFVGSPLDSVDEATLIKVAKKLKKEKVNVDVISFGEDAANADLLQKFIDAVNGKDGTGSHLVTIPPGAHHLSDALISSAVLQGEDGAGGAGGLIATGGGGFEFGVDPNEDPELALALRVSMEEQRARQEAENPAAAADKPAEGGDAAKAAPAAGEGGDKAAAEDPDSDEAMLQRALAMSMETGEEDGAAAGGSGAAAKEPEVDLAAMTEEEQIAYAMKMSMGGEGDEAKKDEEMEVDEDDEMNDPAYLRSVLESLPGVDPQSEAVKTLTGEAKKSEDKKDEDKDKK